jgi:hypothetical protein
MTSALLDKILIFCNIEPPQNVASEVDRKSVALLSFVSRKSSSTMYSSITLFISFHTILIRHVTKYLADFLSSDFDSINKTKAINLHLLQTQQFRGLETSVIRFMRPVNCDFIMYNSAYESRYKSSITNGHDCKHFG